MLLLVTPNHALPTTFRGSLGIQPYRQPRVSQESDLALTVLVGQLDQYFLLVNGPAEGRYDGYVCSVAYLNSRTGPLNNPSYPPP